MSRLLPPGKDATEPCAYSEVLAALLDLVGREVELSVTAKRRPARQLIAAVGRLDAGPELRGTDDDPLLPIAVGGVELAVKEGWLRTAWRDRTDTSLALLFRGGVLVEIEPVSRSFNRASTFAVADLPETLSTAWKTLVMRGSDSIEATLGELEPGALVRIVTLDGREFQGAFGGVVDDSVELRADEGERRVVPVGAVDRVLIPLRHPGPE